MNIVGGLVITADDGCAAPYNSIKAVGGINGNGGPAIQIVQTGSGWANFYHFTDTMILTSGAFSIIQQTNRRLPTHRDCGFSTIVILSRPARSTIAG